jgi:hypothetical protein
VDARDDDDCDGIPKRVGRQKVVMFPSGRVFLTKCVNVNETENGDVDVAVVRIGEEVNLMVESSVFGDGELPSSSLASTACRQGDRLFSIGNPSNVNLESNRGKVHFEPPTWHASVGACQGYMDLEAQRALAEQSDRGRAPTRGEKKRVSEAPAQREETDGGYLRHSCWTYWGHSGAPLYNENGEIAGMHCAWDDRTGMRHGQKLSHLKACFGKRN